MAKTMHLSPANRRPSHRSTHAQAQSSQSHRPRPLRDPRGVRARLRRACGCLFPARSGACSSAAKLGRSRQEHNTGTAHDTCLSSMTDLPWLAQSVIRCEPISRLAAPFARAPTVPPMVAWPDRARTYSGARHSTGHSDFPDTRSNWVETRQQLNAVRLDTALSPSNGPPRACSAR